MRVLRFVAFETCKAPRGGLDLGLGLGRFLFLLPRLEGGVRVRVGVQGKC